jgi:hypothetical protein
VGEPLKRIYKASQEKKENSSPGVPNGFCFSTYQHPVVCFRNELACVIAPYKTAFVFVLLLLFVCLCLLHSRCHTAGTATIYASSCALMKQNTHSSEEEVDRPINVQV